MLVLLENLVETMVHAEAQLMGVTINKKEEAVAEVQGFRFRRLITMIRFIQPIRLLPCRPIVEALDPLEPFVVLITITVSPEVLIPLLIHYPQ